MSGHSKWSTIKRQKEITDKKRGQIFTRLAHAITIAVREGGSPDPDTNFKLRLVIDKAKQANMPKANIQKAIERGQGRGEGAALEEIFYEAFAPGGTALLIKVATDNRQRAAQEIRQIVTRGGGTMAGGGSVSYLFEPAGHIFLPSHQDEKVVLQLMDIPGISDVNQVEGGIEISTLPDRLAEVRQALVGQNLAVAETELVMSPKTLVDLSPENKQKVTTLLSRLENSPEVQAVFTNADL